MIAPLQAVDLEVVLGGRPVLRGVTLALQPGWTAIVGPNGAGKSTLLRALAGLLPARAGQVRLLDRPLAAWSHAQRAQRIAWLSQQGPSGGELTVRELVALGRLPHLGLFGTPGPLDRWLVEQAMQDTECSAWAERRLGQLSGGERQRCLLARALAVQAPVLLLDEPTTHLDPPHQVAVVRLLRRLAASCTVVSVLHDLPLALQADRLVLLRDGRLVACGAHDDVALHAALQQVFEHALRIERAGSRYTALPDLG
jgi:iron complex transport system ATP-binding protein